MVTQILRVLTRPVHEAEEEFCALLLITFNEFKVPSTIRVPGDQSQTIVYASRNKLLLPKMFGVWACQSKM